MPLMTCLGMRNSLRSSRNGLSKEQCRCVIHWGRIFYFLHDLLKTLRKNLLLSCWGLFFWCIGLTGEKSSASSQGILQVYLIWGILWGRISYFLTGDCLNVLRSIREESYASSIGMIFIREESSTSLLGMMLDVF